MSTLFSARTCREKNKQTKAHQRERRVGVCADSTLRVSFRRRWLEGQRLPQAESQESQVKFGQPAERGAGRAPRRTMGSLVL
jgi:hypothetical protein